MPVVNTAKLADRHTEDLKINQKEQNCLTEQSHTSSYQEVSAALKELEAFSLSSSEEINDNIEQLVECIDNNAQALNKAIKDMTAIPKNYPNYA